PRRRAERAAGTARASGRDASSSTRVLPGPPARPRGAPGRPTREERRRESSFATSLSLLGGGILPLDLLLVLFLELDDDRSRRGARGSAGRLDHSEAGAVHRLAGSQAPRAARVRAELRLELLVL